MGAKVALWNQLSRHVVIDPNATVGAQVGVNLLDPSGKLVNWNDILNPTDSGQSGSIDTTDDLDEGAFNFYFTDDRFYAALKADLVESANVSVTFDDSGQTATFDLTDVSPTVGGTLSKWGFDSKGRLAAGDTASTSDLPEGTNLYYTALRIQKGAETFAIAAGVADALTAAFTPAIATITDGMQIKVRALLENATTTPTLKVDANAAITITKNGGDALAIGDIKGPGHELLLRYNETSDLWELLNPAVAGGSGGAVWGGITGTLSDQTDLQAALDEKHNLQTISLIATDSLSASAMISIWDNSGVWSAQNAIAADDTKVAEGFVQSAFSIGDAALVYLVGNIVTGLSGLVPGDVFLSPTVAGGVTNTPPSTSGQMVQTVGFATSATSMIFQPTPGILRG